MNYPKLISRWRTLLAIILLQCLLRNGVSFTISSSTSIRTRSTNKQNLYRSTHLLASAKVSEVVSTEKLLLLRHLQATSDYLDSLYTNSSSSIKCPFWRRRVADSIDNVAMIIRFLVVRHKSLFSALPCEIEIPGCKAVGRHVTMNPDGTVCKHNNLPIEELCNIISKDWSTYNDKGYYITGRLNSTIYKDDCMFDGPDPDMPVKGLRKYLAAASNLFDAKDSFAQLIDLSIVAKEQGKYGNGVIMARWKLGGRLMLPWKPKVKEWTGWTKYHLDSDGLIALHEEGWDISVPEAFINVIWPDLGKRIWDK